MSKLRETFRIRRAHHVVLALGIALAGCSEEEAVRVVPDRNSLGEEIFAVVCDRVSALALREDLSGESFRGICHRTDGTFQDRIDESKLPEPSGDVTDKDGVAVSQDVQKANRAQALARISALVRRRSDFIRALDAALPELRVAVKDISNADPAKSCEPPAEGGEGDFHDELANLLGRLTDLYNDGTIPESTRSLGKILQSFQDSKSAQDAYTRISPRQGYRPAKVALGVARPSVAYPGLRDLAIAMVGAVSADPDPYRTGEPAGSARPAFLKLLEVMHHEWKNAKADPTPAPLVTLTDLQSSRTSLSRPRGTLEVAQALLLAEDPSFGGGDPKYVVKRDVRGMAFIPLVGGAIPAPFVDSNGDKLADVDGQGRFITSGNAIAPTPFFTAGEAATPRDQYQRATRQGGLYYDYVNTSQSFAAAVMRDLFALADPEDSSDALMQMAAGIPVVGGARANVSRKYGNGTSVEYNGIKAAESPMLDAIYGAAQLLGDPATDEGLQLFRQVFDKHESAVARVAGSLLADLDFAHRPEFDGVTVGKKVTFWDDFLEVIGRAAAVPGLLADVFDALAAPDSAQLGNVFGQYAKFRDEINYDPKDVNGRPLNVTTGDKSEPKSPVDRSKPDTGENRSILQRVFSLIADSRNVTACNKEGARVHAVIKKLGITTRVTIPPTTNRPFQECQVFKMDDLAIFFLQSIVGKAKFNLRDDLVRTGLGVAPATAALMEDSSYIKGFWPVAVDTDIRPKPEWLSRLVFWNLEKDGPISGDPNHDTNLFIADLNGPYLGSNTCLERVIDDPCANGGCDFAASPAAVNDVAADGKVRKLRNCPRTDYLRERDKNTIVAFETFGAYKAMTPLVNAFAKYNREDLFLDVVVAANKHWQTNKGTAVECKVAGGVPCAKSGLSNYEVILSQVLTGDTLIALNGLMKVIKPLKVKRCQSVGATGLCSGTTTDVDAFVALEDLTRAALDPTRAKAQGLKDRSGKVTARRNDGTEAPQTTPAYILANAISAMEDSYETYPDGANRKAAFRKARSRLADQFLKYTGPKEQAKFANVGVAKVATIAIDVLRSQLWARCPKTFVSPNEPCPWIRGTLPKNIEETITGPSYAAAVDFADALRQNEPARKESAKLLRFLLDPGSQNDALQATLTAALDLSQALVDDTNLVPFLRVLADAFAPSEVNGQGAILRAGMVDAQLNLLGKVSSRYVDKGRQICQREIDPNQVLPIMLQKFLTPMTLKGLEGKTPFEVVVDVISEVNRANPAAPVSEAYGPIDYTNISKEVMFFLLDKQSGLEQLYEIIRQGSAK